MSDADPSFDFIIVSTSLLGGKATLFQSRPPAIIAEPIRTGDGRLSMYINRPFPSC